MVRMKDRKDLRRRNKKVAENEEDHNQDDCVKRDLRKAEEK